MSVWYTARATKWSTKAMIAAGALTVLLVAAVPVAFVVGVIMMLLGHVVGGLAIFGASILVAALAVGVVSVTGARSLRKAASRIGQWERPDYASWERPDYTEYPPEYPVVRLNRDEYHYD